MKEIDSAPAKMWLYRLVILLLFAVFVAGALATNGYFGSASKTVEAASWCAVFCVVYGSAFATKVGGEWWIDSAPATVRQVPLIASALLVTASAIMHWQFDLMWQAFGTLFLSFPPVTMFAVGWVWTQQSRNSPT